MKKICLIFLVIVLLFGLCSCKPPSHRKLEFDDGTSYCFEGTCGIHDKYISIEGNLFSDIDTQYISIGDREYMITKCDCENIKK